MEGERDSKKRLNCREGIEAIHSTTASVKQSVIKYHEGINENLINTRNNDLARVHNNVEGSNQEFVNNSFQKNSGTSNLMKSWINGTSNPFSKDYSKRETFFTVGRFKKHTFFQINLHFWILVLLHEKTIHELFQNL